MLKKTITYHDLDGEETTEDFYFHMSKGEVLKQQIGEGGAMDVKIDRLMQERDYKEIVKIIDEFIDLSYGIRSENGKSFIKNAKNLESFKSSDAYSELIWELYNDDEAMREFLDKIFPTEMQDAAEQIRESRSTEVIEAEVVE